ncbi:cysteine hydrolase [Thiocystis violacea]|uniref:cysteine hydrolase n=1 Tax=Thiocystis violacea TaxID=13725 RepID=UPI0019083285|nr:cysteine hydrolase [Thiocystis violacea]MBK1724296.1 isochorismatase [Thiocystis violacea]
MNPKTTALVLIGYQNDYFANDGVLHSVVEESVDQVLENTLALLRVLEKTDVLIVTTPIIFTPDYSELTQPVGILKVIKEAGAFKAGTMGAQTIPEIHRFGSRIVEVPGKRGLNAFADTNLHKVLQERHIEDLILAGAVTSICIDSTGRAAFERNYRVTQLSDCTSGRTSVEQSFYCNNVFPLYATVADSRDLLSQLGVGDSDDAQ